MQNNIRIWIVRCALKGLTAYASEALLREPFTEVEKGNRVEVPRTSGEAKHIPPLLYTSDDGVWDMGVFQVMKELLGPTFNCALSCI